MKLERGKCLSTASCTTPSSSFFLPRNCECSYFYRTKNCFFKLNKNKMERCKFWRGSRRPIDFRSHVKTRKPWAHFRPPDLPSHLRDCIVIWLCHVGACSWQWRLPFQDCIARSLALADQGLALACFWQMLDPFYTSSLHYLGRKTNSAKKKR